MTDCKSFQEYQSPDRDQVFRHLAHELSQIGNSTAFRYMERCAMECKQVAGKSYSIFKKRRSNK
jgi:hypothetical protein